MVALAAAGILALVAPSARMFVLEDICLDSGGAMDRETRRCER
jgi:hypothetical protein